MLDIGLANLEDLRYEKKFVISNLSCGEIESIIKHNPAMFLELYPKREVSNIYLDYLGMDNFQDSVNGISQRLKIRIRWYGEVFGEIKKPILELKIKRDEIGKKLLFPLAPFKLDRNFSAELLGEVFEKSNLPGWLSHRLKLLSPTLLNHYTRKYFTSADKKVRITFDFNLWFVKIGRRNNLFKRVEFDKENKIIELKYSDKDGDRVSQITNHFPFRLSRSSKYVMGINLLEF